MNLKIINLLMGLQVMGLVAASLFANDDHPFRKTETFPVIFGSHKE